MELFDRDGREWVRFWIVPEHAGGLQIEAATAIVDRRIVTDSGGHRAERLFIGTRLELAGVSRAIEINLSDRRDMLFPMLLGRTALAGRFVIDPARSFIHGDPPMPRQDRP